MLEGKLIVGRYIDGLPDAQATNGAAVAGIQPMAPVMLHINESSRSYRGAKGFGAKSSDIGAGHLAAKPHRNYQWLKWVQGSVSEVPQNGVDVLTGPMSGCWITRYMRNGVQMVGHVGTDMDAGNVNSIAAKAAWNGLVAAGGAAATGFNPTRDYLALTPALPASKTGENGAPKFFALVTAAGNFFTICTFNIAHTQSLRIAAVQAVGNTLVNPVP
jgi:hypothetical protein